MLLSLNSVTDEDIAKTKCEIMRDVCNSMRIDLHGSNFEFYSCGISIFTKVACF